MQRKPFLCELLTDERLVVVDGGPDIPAPSPDDHGVVDVVVETLTHVDGLLPGCPQLQRYPHLSRAREGHHHYSWNVNESIKS